MYRGSIAILEMSLQAGPSVSLLAHLFHLAVTTTAGMHELCRAPGDTQTLERLFPVLRVPPHRVGTATMSFE